MVRSDFLHSFIGHPLMALLHLIGLEQAGDWVHDKLFPVADRDPDPDLPPLVFTYTNWRGETSQRQVQPIGLFHGATKWHSDPQWLLQAFDLDKGQERAFTVKDVVFSGGAGQAEAIAREMANEMVRAREALNNFVRESADPGADTMSSLWCMKQLLTKARMAGLLSEGEGAQHAHLDPEEERPSPQFLAWWAETGTAGVGEGCNKPFWLRSDALRYVREHGGHIKPLEAVAYPWNRQPPPALETNPQGAATPMARVTAEFCQVIREMVDVASGEDADPEFDPEQMALIDGWQSRIRDACAPYDPYRDNPAAPPAAQGWMPIATAPMDGTRIDVWLGNDEFPMRRTDVYWGRPHHECGEAGSYCDSCPPDRDMWCDDHSYGEPEDLNPTHWMPIAAAPGAQPGQPDAEERGEPTYRICITPDMTYDEINAAAAAEEARVDALTETAKRIAVGYWNSWREGLPPIAGEMIDANWNGCGDDVRRAFISAARASAPEVVDARTKKLLQRAGILSGVARHIKGGKPMTKDVADMLSADANHILRELAALGISHCGISDTEAAALRSAGEGR